MIGLVKTRKSLQFDDFMVIIGFPGFPVPVPVVVFKQ